MWLPISPTPPCITNQWVESNTSFRAGRRNYLYCLVFTRQKHRSISPSPSRSAASVPSLGCQLGGKAHETLFLCRSYIIRSYFLLPHPLLRARTHHGKGAAVLTWTFPCIFATQATLKGLPASRQSLNPAQHNPFAAALQDRSSFLHGVAWSDPVGTGPPKWLAQNHAPSICHFSAQGCCCSQGWRFELGCANAPAGIESRRGPS